MNQDELKKKVAEYVLKYIPFNTIIGIGTGSTVSYFIDALSTIKHLIKGVVSSSHSSTLKLKNFGFSIYDLNKVNKIMVYIDGADEINHQLQMIKGGGAALTREKIIASVANKFICIVDKSKYVKYLGSFPLPIEVIPIACNYVINKMNKFGGICKCRNNVITENGNIIIDVYNLKIYDPIKLENSINLIDGVVTVGLFANRKADLLLIGTEYGVEKIYC
ncbi:ribose-5-phosphate isomerase RpiA [Candidatus Purcelliella pentastirinorum]|uniref:Ribose-5-phosphate isomerase A n=1 Tax=Candidatus Purcelliella pentastirinorum TaxID=472834 RepID=A0A346DZ30_9ENTR|nr:ribose-5-phosphate isomerase RpiA [Candidatus Purcelliella pentastirinorum]AXN01985.1 Ribose 5-phosphate isomerase A [Candidatus Purcelliella pentastirinorum]WDI78954.1 ribose-5-phosphate isomerase RpiA [Candidatus Purcelliella pentastirinorum]WDR80090.1 ribose-5-phosphate isomerase RpiA [Candidatus Purcelliella pentastirinorum]